MQLAQQCLAVRAQQRLDIGVQGVLGEKVLRGGRQHSQFGVQYRDVEVDDAVADAGRPPAAQPMPQCEAAQRCQRLGRQFHIGNVDAGVRAGDRARQRIDHRHVPLLPDNPP